MNVLEIKTTKGNKEHIMDNLMFDASQAHVKEEVHGGRVYIGGTKHKTKSLHSLFDHKIVYRGLTVLEDRIVLYDVENIPYVLEVIEEQVEAKGLQEVICEVGEIE